LHDEQVTATEGRTTNPLWSGQNRTTTIGILMVITMAAFEHLGVGTAMPRMLAELGGNDLYSWPFTTFLAGSVMATVLSGRLCDRLGPGPALVIGPSLFLGGLIVGGLAGTMPVLLAGRALQGLGLGTEIVAIYVLVALVYPERSRPQAFGLLAAAWVVPSLIGPAIAGLVTEHLGWRWVFLGLIPPGVVGILIMLATVRRLPKLDDDVSKATPRRNVALAAVATAFGVTALTWAAQHPSWSTLWLGVAGVLALVPALRVLLPRGTLTARPGLPMTILARGLFAGAFFGVEAYVPLTMVAVHGMSPALAGLSLTSGALGWALASNWQGRHPELPRLTVIRFSHVGLAGTLAAMVLIAPNWSLALLVYPLWFLAGIAMGLAIPAIGVLVLEYAPPRDRGFASAALQVSDMVFSAVMVGLGGVLLTTLASATAPTAALIPLDLLMAGVALLGAVAFRPSRVTKFRESGLP
jgi:MFS family permease